MPARSIKSLIIFCLTLIPLHSATAEPNGVLTIEYIDNEITLGDWTKIRVSLKSTGSAPGPEGGHIAISFPNLTSSTDDQLVSLSSQSNDMGLNIYPRGYYPIYRINGTARTASYLLVESSDSQWTASEQNFVEILVKPITTGSFTVNIRGALHFTGSNWLYTPGSSQTSYTDSQQGHPVQRRVINVKPQPPSNPNLKPYTPSGWSYPIVPSSVKGTNAVNTLRANEPPYIDWAIESNGQVDIDQAFYTDLYIDGIKKYTWTTNNLRAGYYISITDWLSTVTFTPGRHTLKIVADATNCRFAHF